MYIFALNYVRHEVFTLKCLFKVYVWKHSKFRIQSVKVFHLLAICNNKKSLSRCQNTLFVEWTRCVCVSVFVFFCKASIFYCSALIIIQERIQIGFGFGFGFGFILLLHLFNWDWINRQLIAFSTYIISIVLVQLQCRIRNRFASVANQLIDCHKTATFTQYQTCLMVIAVVFSV